MTLIPEISDAAGPAAAPTTADSAQGVLTQAQVVDELIALLRTEVGPDTDLSAESAFEDVGLDSMRVMSIVFKIEARHDIELDEEDADDLRTVADLAGLVVRRVRERA